MNGFRGFRLGLASLILGVASSALSSVSYSCYEVWVANARDVQRLADSPVSLFGEDIVLGSNRVAVKKGQELSIALLGLKSRYMGVYDPVVEPSFGDADYRTEWLTYDQIMAEWDEIMAAYPHLIQKKQIGLTRQSRPIFAYRFYEAIDHDVFSPPKSMLFIGDTHAREWISPSSLLHIGKMLALELATQDNLFTSKLVDKIGLWFVPVLNVDGYIFSWTERMWRKNRRNNGNNVFGVDINRNYEKGWGGQGSSGSPSSDVYRGPSAASEPELQAAKNLAISLPNLLAVIDYHSYGGKILYPWSYTLTPTAPAIAAPMIAAGDAMKDAIFSFSADEYVVGQGSIALYVASGSSKDWFLDRFGCLAYTVEIAGTTFDPPTSSIAPTQDHQWVGFKAFITASAP